MGYDYDKHLGDVVTEVREDGLRYRSKVGGSPFGMVLASPGEASRTCFCCGTRLSRTQQMVQVFGTKAQVVCKSLCEANVIGRKRAEKERLRQEAQALAEAQPDPEVFGQDDQEVVCDEKREIH